MPTGSDNRHIPFESCFNFRDVGGYPARDGQALCWGKLFRSADLCYMTAEEALGARNTPGIKTVIDLRASWEAESYGYGPLTESPVQYNNIPLFGNTRPEDNAKSYEALAKNPAFQMPSLLDVYLMRLREPGFWEMLAAILEIIVSPDSGPVVFHCVAGKDRTGVLAAMIQGYLGVADEDIIADYALTEECKAPPALNEMRTARIQANPRMAEMYKNLPADFLHALPETMEKVLEDIHREHESVRSFVAAQGVRPELLKKLEEVLLEG